MAMNGNALGTAIKNAVEALGASTDREAYWQAIGEEVVKHIQTNAVVTSTVAVVSVSAVTPGVGASGPGTGTATGTIA